MKITFLLISILFVNFLHAQDFEIIEATSQNWTGGTARSGHGVNYKIAIVCKKKMKKLKFDKLWVNNEALTIKTTKDNLGRNFFSENDTILLAARKTVKTNEYGEEIKEAEKEETPPAKFESDALISYMVKKKEKYFLIPKLKQLKAIYYP